MDREAGDAITQLKLQKLMYIAQGIHLALYDKPLFKEEIEAWQHGPVVRELYHEFKGYGTDPIPLRIASVSYAMKRQGEFPVIFLSLKDIKGNNYQIMESKVREKIIKVFDHEYLLNSTYISSLDKKKFEDYLSVHYYF